jgi:hypothetical protein
MIVPPILSTTEYATALGIAPSRLNEWTRAGGFLADAPRERGTMSRADVLLGLVALELGHVMGERSPRVAAVMKEVGPRLRGMIAAGSLPDTLRIRLDADGTMVAVDLSPMQLFDDVESFA